MSKKVRRAKRGPRPSQVQKAKQAQNAAKETAIAPSASADKPRSERQRANKRGRGRIRTVSMDELREEYDYVIKDLRRIFILAIVMFVLLFAANFAFPFLLG